MNALHLQQCVTAIDEFFPPEDIALLIVCGLFFLMGLILTFSASIRVANAGVIYHSAHRLLESQTQEIIRLRSELRNAKHQAQHE